MPRKGDPRAAAVTAPDLIMHFLSVVREATTTRIIRYMGTIGYARGTTRNTLSKLALAGKIKRVGFGRYRTVDE